MTLYCGIDLHSNNSVVVVTNESDQVVFQSRFPNDLDLIRQALQPFQAELAGVVVESTYNWYWLVDGLMDAGFSLHLATPAAIKHSRAQAQRRSFGCAVVSPPATFGNLARRLYLPQSGTTPT